MNHGRSNRKFGREKNQRNALLKSLALSLVLEEKIKTTEPKAKEIRPFVEKLITLSKNGTVATERLLNARIGTAGSKKLVKVLGPKYKERAGGYIRITKLNDRKSDGSKMAQVELI
jgi:large subunit ribosomal protein L17